MKKIAGKVVFILIGTSVLLLSIGSGFFLSTKWTESFKYGYFKTDFKGYSVRNISYGEGDLENYDLYFPADDSKQEYSLILYIHGGGFTGGDKSTIDSVRYGEYFSNKGYVVASVNYTYRTEENDSSVQNMYEEVVSSLNSIYKISKEKGFKLTEMATTGGSAGGALAMQVAYKNPEDLPLPIRLVFQEVGPASFEPELWGITEPKEMVNFVNNITGSSFDSSDVQSEKFQESIDSMSIDKMIKEDSVPIVLAYGQKDKVVDPRAKYPLIKALEKNKIDHIYVEFPESGHGLLGDKDNLEVYYNAIEEYLEKYMPTKWVNYLYIY